MRLRGWHVVWYRVVRPHLPHGAQRRCFAALLPYCVIALLPYCVIALLPLIPRRTQKRGGESLARAVQCHVMSCRVTSYNALHHLLHHVSHHVLPRFPSTIWTKRGDLDEYDKLYRDLEFQHGQRSRTRLCRRFGRISISHHPSSM